MKMKVADRAQESLANICVSGKRHEQISCAQPPGSGLKTDFSCLCPIMDVVWVRDDEVEWKTPHEFRPILPSVGAGCQRVSRVIPGSIAEPVQPED